MHELLQAFLLGNAAILTNVCILPLYPGLLAFLAGTAQDSRGHKALPWLGLLVLGGVLSLMLVVGWLLYVLQASFGAVLPWLLPLIYGAVVILGVLLLAGRNPFQRLSMAVGPAQAATPRNPYLAAYLYGLLLGPMTLPCAGPIVVSAFLLGAGSAQQLASSLLYFLAFGLGFGWPLVLLPLLAQGFQRRFTGWAVRNDRLLTAASGVLLIAIGLVGFIVEVSPNL
jgi:cytochrome c-type biogenesis protein